MNKTPTTLIIMDGFGLAVPKRRQRRQRWPKRPVLDRLLPGIRPHHARPPAAWTWVCPPGRWATARWATPTSARGRVVFQDLPRISRAIEDGSFFENQAYYTAMDDCLKHGQPRCTCMGLLSDGGVHSHIEHLFALLRNGQATRALTKVYVHCLPGRPRRVPHLAARALWHELRGQVPRSSAWARSPR